MVRAFGRIGLLSFGGPAAQIAVMQDELVDRRAWLDRETFLRGLGFCTLLPGPEAMQLSTFAGWRLAGWRGGLAAGLLFVLPGAVVMATLATLYLAYGRLPLVEAAFLGVKAATLAIVAGALWTLRRKALDGGFATGLAVASFLALFLVGVPFWAVVGAALLIGAFRGGPMPGHVPAPVPAGGVATLRVVATWLAVWWAPLLVVMAAAPGTPAAQAATFFSWLATVSFGGAYAVLAALAQVAVEDFGWLTPEQMLDGLGLAETTPGPLILVTLFTAILGGAQGGWGMAASTGAVCLWATFAPCFLWIFAGAPHLMRLTADPRLAGALRAVTAAVVGVVANLAIWFAIHLLFLRVPPRPGWGPPVPDWSSIDVTAAGLCLFALVWHLGLRRGLGETLALAAAAGLALALV